MAIRPVFCVKETQPYFAEESITFEFNPGFSATQKRKNISNIHNEFCARHHNAKILEISSKSDIFLGTQLSAFCLRVHVGNVETTVESAFQSGKVFQYGGPYIDLLTAPSIVAKKDPRLQNSGPLRSFCLDNVSFPLEPKTFFYDWLYLKALSENTDIAKELCKYNAFTDIEFNPGKSINCQARSAAIFASLCQLNMIKEVMQSPERFKQTVYGLETRDDTQQMSLF